MPVIEEISDDEIDNAHLSLEEFDPHNPFSRSMPVEGGLQLRPTPTPAPSSQVSQVTPVPQVSQVSQVPEASLASQNSPLPGTHGTKLPDYMSSWTQIYPVYFNSNKTRKQGRRVDNVYAVKNPLAVLIADACRALGLTIALELTKTHPKDWSNPGRVRVQIPEGTSKAQLLVNISKKLKTLPVTEESARRDLYKKLAMFDSMKPIASLRNDKLLQILPGASPALSAKNAIDAAMKQDAQMMQSKN